MMAEKSDEVRKCSDFYEKQTQNPTKKLKKRQENLINAKRDNKGQPQ